MKPIIRTQFHYTQFHYDMSVSDSPFYSLQPRISALLFYYILTLISYIRRFDNNCFYHPPCIDSTIANVYLVRCSL